jgi:hypothetical protein
MQMQICMAVFPFTLTQLHLFLRSTAQVALVNGAPLKGVVRNASTNAAWPR